jgi:phenylpyruvate tautomerase PptA (4-oxalocrotonate tautomerase family)
MKVEKWGRNTVSQKWARHAKSDNGVTSPIIEAMKAEKWGRNTVSQKWGRNTEFDDGVTSPFY